MEIFQQPFFSALINDLVNMLSSLKWYSRSKTIFLYAQGHGHPEVFDSYKSKVFDETILAVQIWWKFVLIRFIQEKKGSVFKKSNLSIVIVHPMLVE